ncbi:acyltransferase family protein [Kluyvera ascorbata]|uniref:acyltransferase family protein n=1 Tax=Kluyvera ascorbata TaxID=51288 RepID=UPI0039F63CF8
MKSKTLNGVTIFRFIAAFYVFIFHLNMRFHVDAPPWLLKVINNGAIGMTFFFVLSGFVMAWSSKNGIRNNYFKSRILRIYPAYFFMGIISLPILLDLNYQKITSALILFISGTQSLIPASFNIWNFSGSWSVSTEMFFYVTFPLLYPLIKKHPIHYLVVAYLISSFMIPIAYFIDGSPSFPYYYVSPLHRLPEFVVGVSVGVLFSEGRINIKSTTAKAIISVASIMLLTLISTRHNIGYMNSNFSTVMATALLLVVMASLSIKNEGVYIPFIYLGKISYSFYLMQIPIFLYIDKYKYLFEGYNSLYMWILIGVVNLLISSFVYHFVEARFSMKNKESSVISNIS